MARNHGIYIAAIYRFFVGTMGLMQDPEEQELNKIKRVIHQSPAKNSELAPDFGKRS